MPQQCRLICDGFRLHSVRPGTRRWLLVDLEAGPRKCAFPYPSCGVVALLSIAVHLEDSSRGGPFDLFFFFGFVSRKREEENKRKEAEQQKGLLSTDPRPQALPCPPSPQNEPSKQGAAPSKQPPAGHTVQGPDLEPSRRSPGPCPGRASHRDCSSDLQGTASRKPNGKCGLRYLTQPWTGLCLAVRPSRGLPRCGLCPLFLWLSGFWLFSCLAVVY